VRSRATMGNLMCGTSCASFVAIKKPIGIKKGDEPWKILNTGIKQELVGYEKSFAKAYHPCGIESAESIPLVVYMSGAVNVPMMDVVLSTGKNHHRGCDPYVKIWVTKWDEHDLNEEDKDKVQQWPVRNQNRHPMWNSARQLHLPLEVSADGIPEVEQLKLHVAMYDYDGLSADDPIGYHHLPVENLMFGLPTEVSLSLDKTRASKCDLEAGSASSFSVISDGGEGGSKSKVPKVYLCLLRPTPKKKTVYFIRHAESTWNEAQGSHDVATMIESRDNPLSEDGIQQVFDLKKKLEACLKKLETASASEKGFFEASAMWASPLTRALQTCLLGCTPANKRIGKIRLMPNAREKRNLGGLDTSGSETGADIVVRAYNCSVSEGNVEKAIALDAFDQEFDLAEVQYKWWNENSESSDTVKDRMNDFMSQIRYGPEEAIIIVGHSHYFREMFVEYLDDAFAAQNAEFSGELKKMRLSNAGVARVDMDFTKPEKVITKVELLFGTTMMK